MVHLASLDIWFLHLLTLLLSIHISYVISVLFQYILSLYTHCLYARALFLYLTHSLGHFWWPWICTSRYWIFYALAQVFVELVHFARSWSFSLSSFGILISPIFLLFFDSRYISDSVFIPVLFIWYYVWMLICDIAIIMFCYSIDA